MMMISFTRFFILRSLEYTSAKSSKVLGIVWVLQYIHVSFHFSQHSSCTMYVQLQSNSGIIA